MRLTRPYPFSVTYDEKRRCQCPSDGVNHRIDGRVGEALPELATPPLQGPFFPVASRRRSGELLQLSFKTTHPHEFRVRFPGVLERKPEGPDEGPLVVLARGKWIFAHVNGNTVKGEAKSEHDLHSLEFEEVGSGNGRATRVRIKRPGKGKTAQSFDAIARKPRGVVALTRDPQSSANLQEEGASFSCRLCQLPIPLPARQLEDAKQTGRMLHLLYPEPDKDLAEQRAELDASQRQLERQDPTYGRVLEQVNRIRDVFRRLLRFVAGSKGLAAWERRRPQLLDAHAPAASPEDDQTIEAAIDELELFEEVTRRALTVRLSQRTPNVDHVADCILEAARRGEGCLSVDPLDDEHGQP